MRMRPSLLAGILIVLLGHGCQTLQTSLSEQKGQNVQPSSEVSGPVEAGTVTGNGELERRYNKIERGMTRKAVESILGRPSDQCVCPGGSLGDELCWWFEERATISVTFEWGTGRVSQMSIRKTSRKEGW
jgi:hypothetical protein